MSALSKFHSTRLSIQELLSGRIRLQRYGLFLKLKHLYPNKMQINFILATRLQRYGLFLKLKQPYNKFFLRKKYQSLIFALKIPVIFLMINNLTSMTLLEKCGKKYHQCIMEVSSYVSGSAFIPCIIQKKKQ